MIITGFDSFVDVLMRTGFSIGGDNPEGIFSLGAHFGDNIEWHTDNPETDPWEWRMRVLEERDDIAYAKVFFRKSGFITKAWYPYFLAARRDGKIFEDDWQDGRVSIYAKRIYDVIEANGPLPFHEIKRLGNFAKEDNARFEKALIDLQMMMYITMCGRASKASVRGEYGWWSTVFCTVEAFFDDMATDGIRKAEAAEKISEQIRKLNPAADERKISKFIFGR